MTVHRPNDLPLSEQNDESAVNIQVELGKKLSELRNHHNMSLMSLAQATRININFIQAMERGKFVKDLPGEVFARGFVKNICKALGEDPKAYLAMLDQVFVKESEDSNSSLEESRRKLHVPWAHFDLSRFKLSIGGAWRKRFTWMLASVGILGVLGVLVTVWIVPFTEQASKDLAAKKTQHQTVLEPRAAESVKTAETANQVASAPKTASGGDHMTGADATGHIPPTEPARHVATTTTAKVNGASDLGERPASQGQHVVAAAPNTASNGEPATTSPLAEGSRDDLSTSSDTSRVTADAAIGPVEKGVLALSVKEPVRLRIGLDGNQPEYKKLEPQDLVVSFDKRADLLIFDAAAVEITFNGRSLGSLGKKGRVRRISFDLEKM